MFIILKMNPAAYGCNWQGFPTSPRLAISRSDVGSLFTGTNRGVQQPKLRDCQI